MEETKTLKGYNGIFARRLASLMKTHSAKQTDLADYLGLTRQAISKYTDGSVLPNIENLQKICEYFNVSSDYMIGLSNSDSLVAEERYIIEKTGLHSWSIETLNIFNTSKEDNEKIILMFLNHMLKSRVDLTQLSKRLADCYKHYVREHSKNNLTLKNEEYKLDYRANKFLTCDWFDEIIDDVVLALYKESNQKNGDKNE